MKNFKQDLNYLVTIAAFIMCGLVFFPVNQSKANFVSGDIGEAIMIDGEQQQTINWGAHVLVANRQLLILQNGMYSPYEIKGIGYEPTPIGRFPGDWGYSDPNDPRVDNIYADEKILRRDFKILKKAGINTIRLWHGNNDLVTVEEVENVTSPHFGKWEDVGRNTFHVTHKMLDLAHEYGIKVIPGFKMPWPGESTCKDGQSGYKQYFDYTKSTNQLYLLQKFRDFINEYKGHPAVLFWAIGNENNLAFDLESPEGKEQIRKYHYVANLMGEIAKNNFHNEPHQIRPVAVVHGEINEIGTDLYGTHDNELPNIDIWGVNVYRGDSFHGMFEQFAHRSNKALWVSEYGFDAWHVKNLDRYSEGVESPGSQALGVLRLAKELQVANSDLQTIGGTVFTYTDEWWKPDPWICVGGIDHDNNPSTPNVGHEYCNSTQNHFGTGPQDFSCPKDGIIDWTPASPDKVMNEEWFGLAAIAKSNETYGLEKIRPRSGLIHLAKFFGGNLDECLGVDDCLGEGNRPPVLTPIGNKKVMVGNELIFNVSGTDPDGDDLRFVTGVRPDGASFDPNTKVFSWTPSDNQVDMHSIIFEVDDLRGGLDSETVFISVKPREIIVPEPPDNNYLPKVIRVKHHRDENKITWEGRDRDQDATVPLKYIYKIERKLAGGGFELIVDYNTEDPLIDNGGINEMSVEGLSNGKYHLYMIAIDQWGAESRRAKRKGFRIREAREILREKMEKRLAGSLALGPDSYSLLSDDEEYVSRSASAGMMGSSASSSTCTNTPGPGITLPSVISPGLGEDVESNEVDFQWNTGTAATNNYIVVVWIEETPIYGTSYPGNALPVITTPVTAANAFPPFNGSGIPFDGRDIMFEIIFDNQTVDGMGNPIIFSDCVRTTFDVVNKLNIDLDGFTAADMTWMDVFTNEDNYVVERSEDGGATWSTIATLPAGATSYSDPISGVNKVFHYRVRTKIGTTLVDNTTVERVEIPLFGRITSEGVGIPGATVSISGKRLADKAKVTVSAVTDADGWFAWYNLVEPMDVDKYKAKIKFQKQTARYKLSKEQKDCFKDLTQDNKTAEPLLLDVEFNNDGKVNAFAGDFMVAGRVIDHLGNGIADVEVSISEKQGRKIKLKSRTDPDGYYFFENLTANTDVKGSYKVKVKKKGVRFNNRADKGFLLIVDQDIDDFNFVARTPK